jgi:outer membrane protein insertion porin family
MRETGIERIDIQGNRRIPEDTIRFYIQSKSGDLYSPARLAYDVQALYKSNFFENVELQERDGESGKIIAFVVDERLLIRSIQFIGNRSITESEIIEAFLLNKVGLVLDSQFEYRKAMLAERILKKLLAERGKPKASVRVETETLPPSGIQLRFIIDEGN